MAGMVKRTPEEVARAFRKIAKELGCDKSEDRFRETLSAIGREKIGKTVREIPKRDPKDARRTGSYEAPGLSHPTVRPLGSMGESPNGFAAAFCAQITLVFYSYIVPIRPQNCRSLNFHRAVARSSQANAIILLVQARQQSMTWPQ
jgi:hypothetical protein